MRVSSHRGIVEDQTDAFAVFYEHEWRDVVGLCYVMTGNRSVAEDLTQEAFAAAYRDWDRVADMDNPGAWVRRVVVNRCSSWFRRRSAERRALARMGNPGPAPDPDLDAQTAEVWSKVRSLPRRQRQAIALVYFDGRTVAEASEAMGCSQETARTHLKRGRRRLAQRLGVREGS
jgi:RNA polymerase sigma-70 factor (ECF subfamily)